MSGMQGTVMSVFAGAALVFFLLAGLALFFRGQGKGCLVILGLLVILAGVILICTGGM